MSRTKNRIDPIAIAVFALKQVKTRADYSRIVAANTPKIIDSAWQSLSPEDQQCISAICNNSPSPNLEAIASEIAACGTYLELQSLKTEYGEDVARSAWKLIPPEERLRLKGICQSEQQQAMEPQPVSEQPQQVSQPKPRTLFTISDDLEKLNELLDDCGDNAQQQELIAQWFETLGTERDRKFDNYCALVVEMTSRAAARKAEAQRLMELAASDENRAKMLKDRLKWFFQTHNLKTLDTDRYRLSLAKNGGRQPLILDESVPVTQLPERFQKVSIDPDTTAIRDALERGERLDFAQLGERGTSLRIK